ncbi:hypothetical protein Droror1_Dr00016333 [Drosera rotundifolia]
MGSSCGLSSARCCAWRRLEVAGLCAGLWGLSSWFRLSSKPEIRKESDGSPSSRTKNRYGSVQAAGVMSLDPWDDTRSRVAAQFMVWVDEFELGVWAQRGMKSGWLWEFWGFSCVEIEEDGRKQLAAVWGFRVVRGVKL